MEYESVGCFKDSSERAIESVEGYHSSFLSSSLLYYDYKTRYQAIRKCAVFAKLQGYKMFGIQDGGMCVTSASAHKTYNIYGESDDCKSDGKGGPWANQVYRFPEIQVNSSSLITEGDNLNPKTKGLALLSPAPLLDEDIISTEILLLEIMKTFTYTEMSSLLVNNPYIFLCLALFVMQLERIKTT